MTNNELNNSTWYKVASRSQGMGAIGVSGMYGNRPGASVYGWQFANMASMKAWHIINVSDIGAMLLRNRNLGAPWLLSSTVGTTCDNVNDSSAKCKQCTQAGNCAYYIKHRMIQDDGTGSRWTGMPWGDDSNILYNAQNGSDWKLDIQENKSWLWLDGNITDQTGSGRSIR